MDASYFLEQKFDHVVKPHSICNDNKFECLLISDEKVFSLARVDPKLRTYGKNVKFVQHPIARLTISSVVNRLSPVTLDVALGHPCVLEDFIIKFLRFGRHS